jgi:hypothetical protein
VNARLAKETFTKLLRLPSDIRNPIQLAVDRLGRSRIHPRGPDTALDLGISSEIVLLHDSGVQGEIRYRFALRGAYLLGKDGKDRYAVFKRFRSLYDARSGVAHTGRLDSKWLQSLSEFDALCVAAILAIVERQRFPDWDQLSLGDLNA